MCVIAYKPLNTNFPGKGYLQNCFDNNSDGAGFMYSYKGKVYLQKGYTTYDDFKKALDKARKRTGDKVPYVMHFRIATQGFMQTMTHPFPLNSDMNELKKLNNSCDIGVAHNGIIKMTSDGSHEYSDTMKFITDYLSLIIKDNTWFRDKDKKVLIERMISGSRLAILDKNNHCELLGSGWVQEDGVYYSNSSYSYKKITYDKWDYGWGTHWKTKKSSFSWEDPYEKYYNKKTDLYNFSEANCPLVTDFDDSYCSMCSRFGNCHEYVTDNTQYYTSPCLSSINEI